MALYGAAAATPAPALSAPYAVIRAGAGARIRLKQVGFFLNAATSSTIGLYRASNTPVPTTSALGAPYDTGDSAGTGAVDTVWSTAPTVSGTPFRRILLPATVAAGVIWQFDDLVIGPNGTGALVVWNFNGAAGGSVLQMYADWEE